MDLNTRPGLHEVDTHTASVHHVGVHFRTPAPWRKPISRWARIKAWFIGEADTSERMCCDGKCADGLAPCPFVPTQPQEPRHE